MAFTNSRNAPLISKHIFLFLILVSIFPSFFVTIFSKHSIFCFLYTTQSFKEFQKVFYWLPLSWRVNSIKNSVRGHLSKLQTIDFGKVYQCTLVWNKQRNIFLSSLYSENVTKQIFSSLKLLKWHQSRLVLLLSHRNRIAIGNLFYISMQVFWKRNLFTVCFENFLPKILSYLEYLPYYWLFLIISLYSEFKFRMLRSRE